MNSLLLAVQTIYFVSMVLAVCLAGILWTNRNRVGAIPLTVMNLSIGFWMGCLFISTLPYESIAAWATRVVYLGIGGTVACVFVFALEYTGRERYITGSVLSLLAIHPLTVLFLGVVNPRSVFITDIQHISIGIEQQWGPAFWMHTAYSYLLVISAAVLILGFLFRSRHRLYQGQSIALIVAVIFPFVFNIWYTFGDVFFNMTAVGFLGTSILLTLAILRYQLINVTPVAREKVVDNVRDGMVVVDTENRIVDINQAAENLFGFSNSPVGEDVTELLSSYLELRSKYEDLTQGAVTDEMRVTFDETIFVVESTPIDDARGRQVGWLLLLKDITERIEREQELERQNEQLDQFASLVSHDLRNPLNVAKLRTNLIQQEQRTEHTEAIQRSLTRMETIIDEMLTMARTGQQIEDTERCLLEDIIAEACGNIRTDQVEFEIAVEEAAVQADRNRLLHVFENLFRNAIDHNSPPLLIRVGLLDSATGFYIEDTGEGIPEGERSAIFDRGFTTDNEGSGFGLSIVKNIVDAHGWSITVTEGVDGGARFEIITDSD